MFWSLLFAETLLKEKERRVNNFLAKLRAKAYNSE